MADHKKQNTEFAEHLLEIAEATDDQGRLIVDLSSYSTTTTVDGPKTSDQMMQVEVMQASGVGRRSSIPLTSSMHTMPAMGMPEPPTTAQELQGMAPASAPAPRAREEADIDLRQFDAQAVLSEHDILARRRATHILRTHDRYKHMHFGEAEYFVAFDRLTARERKRLLATYGPPATSFTHAGNWFSQQSNPRLFRRRHSTIGGRVPGLPFQMTRRQSLNPLLLQHLQQWHQEGDIPSDMEPEAPMSGSG